MWRKSQLPHAIEAADTRQHQRAKRTLGKLEQRCALARSGALLLTMHRSRHQFAGIFRFRDVLLRQILGPVFWHVAHPVENALMDVGAGRNFAGSAQVEP